MFEIRLTENEAGQRADRFLRKYLKEYSLGDIYKLFRTNKVKLNGKRVKENQMLKEGDLLQLNVEKPESCILYTSDAADELHCVDLGARRRLQQQIR